jgi:hypothetical protein
MGCNSALLLLGPVLCRTKKIAGVIVNMGYINMKGKQTILKEKVG